MRARTAPATGCSSVNHQTEQGAAGVSGKQGLQSLFLLCSNGRMDRLTPEVLERAINSARAFARADLSAEIELSRYTAARSLSLLIFEQLVPEDRTDDRQLALPLLSIEPCVR